MKNLIIILFLFSCTEEVIWNHDPSQHKLLKRVVNEIADSLSVRGYYMDVSNLGLKVEVLESVLSPTRDAYGMYAENVIYIDEYSFYYWWYTNPIKLKAIVLHEIGHWEGLPHAGKEGYDRFKWGGWNVMRPGVWINVTEEFESGMYDIYVDYAKKN